MKSIRNHMLAHAALATLAAIAGAGALTTRAGAATIAVANDRFAVRADSTRTWDEFNPPGLRREDYVEE